MIPNRRQYLAAVLIAASLLPGTTRAGWQDLLRDLQEAIGGEPAATTPPVTTLSEEEMVRGLREALSVATRRAVDTLGRENGFLTHPEMRIPLPDSLKNVEKLLRRLKQDQVADEFVATLNHAAERAVREGGGLFADAIRDMTLRDAADILRGPDDAATRYFRSRMETPLTRRMRPIVGEATEAAGVTRAYKQVIDKVDVLTHYLKPGETDLDGYVTRRAIDGLFHELAAEEARLRRDPVARTTELLRKVFGTPE